MPAATVTVPSNVFLLDGETVGLSEGEGVVGTGVNGASVGVSVGFEVIGDSDGKGVT